MNALINLSTVPLLFTLPSGMGPPTRRKSAGAGGNTGYVSGRSLERPVTIEIHKISAVSWPPCRQHRGRFFRPSALLATQVEFARE